MDRAARVRLRKAGDLSAVLSAARRRRGWTQAELSDRMGVSRDYVGDLELGPLGKQVSRLLQALGELGVDLVATIPGAGPGSGGEDAASGCPGCAGAPVRGEDA